MEYLDKTLEDNDVPRTSKFYCLIVKKLNVKSRHQQFNNFSS